MSWAEVKKINSDMTKTLDEQFEDSFKLVPLDAPIKNVINSILLSKAGSYTTSTFACSGTVALKCNFYIPSPSGGTVYTDTVSVSAKTSSGKNYSAKTTMSSAYVDTRTLYFAVDVEEGDTITVSTSYTNVSVAGVVYVTVDLCGAFLPQPKNKTILA